MWTTKAGSSNRLEKQPQFCLFSSSLQVDSGITTEDGGRGIGDSDDAAKASDCEENRLIQRKLGLSKQQSHALQEFFKIHNPFTTSSLRLVLAGQLKLRPGIVDNWFSMKRSTERKQSVFLEESFKEHNTLNPKQKLALAKQLNLSLQNRRAGAKLKQTEVDCEYLKRRCETLTEENRRLQKELQEFRALKTSLSNYPDH